MNSEQVTDKQASQQAFWRGCRSALPIAIGYIPVAIAFGMTAQTAGFPAWIIIAMSLLIYAGASQFLLLASIVSGAGLWSVIGLCALLDSRHLLYAPLLKRHLTSSQGMAWIAPLITDEVFATAMSELANIRHQKAWLVGLALISWTSWWGGTIVGVYGGQLLNSYPTMSAVMNFAFVALFVSLSTQFFINEPHHRASLILSAITACLCMMANLGEMALFIASLVGVLAHQLFNRQSKNHAQS